MRLDSIKKAKELNRSVSYKGEKIDLFYALTVIEILDKLTGSNLKRFLEAIEAGRHETLTFRLRG